MKNIVYLSISMTALSTSLMATNIPNLSEEDQIAIAISRSLLGDSIPENSDDINLRIATMASLENPEDTEIKSAITAPLQGNREKEEAAAIRMAIKQSLTEKGDPEEEDLQLAVLLSLQETSGAVKASLQDLKPTNTMRDSDREKEEAAYRQGLMRSFEHLYNSTETQIDHSSTPQKKVTPVIAEVNDKHIIQMSEMFTHLSQKYEKELQSLESKCFPGNPLIHYLELFIYGKEHALTLVEDNPGQQQLINKNYDQLKNSAEKRMEQMKIKAIERGIPQPDDKGYLINQFIQKYGYSYEFANAIYDKMIGNS